MTELILSLSIPVIFGSLEGFYVALKKKKIVIEIFKDTILFLAVLLVINIAIPLKEFAPFLAQCFSAAMVAAMIVYVVFFLSAIIAWILTTKITKD